MKIMQMAKGILGAVARGESVKALVKTSLLYAHDNGVASMRRAVADSLRRKIASERASYGDVVWGGSPDADRIGQRIEVMESLLSSLSGIEQDARKVGASVVCDKCGEDIDPAKDSTCPHCKAFLWRPL